tara:strand:- start:57040 stop:57291 length:252 start_codon:yes stop_codon:yes gene_type:complete
MQPTIRMFTELNKGVSFDMNHTIEEKEVKGVHYTKITKKDLVNNLSISDVSGMFSVDKLKKAYEDGVEHEQQRCGYFDIENYR